VLSVSRMAIVDASTPFYLVEFVISLILNYIPLGCLVVNSNCIPTTVVDGDDVGVELHPR
jgi:hypothetical protein